MVESPFATITVRVRAMMKEAGIDEKLKMNLWAECVRTATILDSLLVYNSKDKCKFELFLWKKIRIDSSSSIIW